MKKDSKLSFCGHYTGQICIFTVSRETTGIDRGQANDTKVYEQALNLLNWYTLQQMMKEYTKRLLISAGM